MKHYGKNLVAQVGATLSPSKYQHDPRTYGVQPTSYGWIVTNQDGHACEFTRHRRVKFYRVRERAEKRAKQLNGTLPY